MRGPLRSERVQLSVPRETFYLGVIRRLVVDLAGRAGLPKESIDRLEMAVDEACANAILHAPELIEQPLELSVSIEPGCFSLSLLDRGATGFDFCGTGELDVDAHNAEGCNGGLGVYIIKRFVDQVDFQVDGEGTCLTMTMLHQPANSYKASDGA